MSVKVSNAVTITKGAIASAIAPGAAGGGLTAAAASLLHLDWISLGIAVAIAGVVAMVSAADRFEREERETRMRTWFLEFGIGAIAGMFAWGAAGMVDLDTRMQIALIAASGWSSRPTLNGGLWIWKRVKGG